MILLFVSTLAETNRVPFDLIEGELELVSGFNIQLSFLFAMFSLAEYYSYSHSSVLGSVLFFYVCKGWAIGFWVRCSVGQYTNIFG